MLQSAEPEDLRFSQGKKLSCEDAEKLKAVEGGKFRIPMARLEIEAGKI